MEIYLSSILSDKPDGGLEIARAFKSKIVAAIVGLVDGFEPSPPLAAPVCEGFRAAGLPAGPAADCPLTPPFRPENPVFIFENGLLGN